MSRTRSATSFLLSPWRRKENATSSATVGITICASGSEKTNATLRRTPAPSRAVSIPSTRTGPVEGTTSPFMSPSRVDFTEPLPPPSNLDQPPHPMDKQREPLAPADGAGRDPEPGTVGPDHLGEQPHHEHGPRRAPGMTHRDRATLWTDSLRIRA